MLFETYPVWPVLINYRGIYHHRLLAGSKNASLQCDFSDPLICGWYTVDPIKRWTRVKRLAGQCRQCLIYGPPFPHLALFDVVTFPISGSFFYLYWFFLKLLSGECHRKPLIVSQRWLRKRRDVTRRDPITWSNFGQDLCRQMASLRHNNLTEWTNILAKQYHV